jgi:hypothetical protein
MNLWPPGHKFIVGIFIGVNVPFHANDVVDLEEARASDRDGAGGLPTLPQSFSGPTGRELAQAQPHS